MIISKIRLAFLIFCAVYLFSYATADTGPQLGMIPSVSNHYKTAPSFYDFNDIQIEQLTDKIGMRFFNGTQTTVIQWKLKKGAKLPIHFHINEQVTRVDDGVLEVFSQGKRYELTQGQILVFPPNVPHEFFALKNTTVYEIQTPTRQDYIAPDFIEKIKKILTEQK